MQELTVLHTIGKLRQYYDNEDGNSYVRQESPKRLSEAAADEFLAALAICAQRGPLRKLHLMNFDLTSKRLAVLLWHHVLGPAVNLRSIHLERMFNVTKYLNLGFDPKLGFGIPHQNLETLYIGDFNFTSKSQIQFAERFKERETWLKLKRVTFEGESKLHDEKLSGLVGTLSQSGTFLNVDKYAVKRF